MKFKSVSVNNCYILGEEIFDTIFFTYLNSKAIYSASIFHLAFFKGDISLITRDTLKKYEKFIIDLYRLNSPFLYVPYEVNFHENYLYQSYYESDHFPLSLMIEEKNLIPFNIFIKILEDTLLGLKTLEKLGYSHHFLTPEEILVPLQWTETNKVKLYNLGLNYIIKTLLNDNEIENYKKNYYPKGKISSDKTPLLNLADDIYSFANIINKIIPLCNFNNEDDKKIIQNTIKTLLNESKSYNSIDEVLQLFDTYFKVNKLEQLIQSTSQNYTYTGQASFDIPEYNEWHEEAELEPYTEDELEPMIPIKKGLHKNNKNLLKKYSNTFIKSISTIFSRIFGRKIISKSVSNTLNNFSQELIDSKNKTITKEVSSKNISITETEEKVIQDLEKELQSNKILENRETQSKVLTTNRKHTETPINKDTISNETTVSGSEYKRFDIDRKYILKELEDHNPNDTMEKELNKIQDLFTNFNKSLSNRDYTRTYELIKTSLSIEFQSDQKIVKNKLSYLLNKKMQELDEHYIKNDRDNLLGLLAKMDMLDPMIDSKLTNEAAAEFRKLLTEESNSFSSEEETDKASDELTFFQKIIQFLKVQIKKIFK